MGRRQHQNKHNKEDTILIDLFAQREQLLAMDISLNKLRLQVARNTLVLKSLSNMLHSDIDGRYRFMIGELDNDELVVHMQNLEIFYSNIKLMFKKNYILERILREDPDSFDTFLDKTCDMKDYMS